MDRVLGLVLSALPIFAAGLFLLGNSWHQGYLEGFGVDGSLFPLRYYDVLFLGFFASLLVGLEPTKYVLFWLFLAFFVALTVAVLARVPSFVSWWESIRAATAPRSVKDRSEADKLVDLTGTASFFVAAAFVGMVVLGLLASLAIRSGRAQAETEIAAFDKREANWVEFFTPALAGPLEAKQIICSDRFCAFWMGTHSMVLPTEDVQRLIVHIPKK